MCHIGYSVTDFIITLHKDGKIDVIKNNDYMFSTYNFTSKKAEYWLLNVSLKTEMDDYTFRLILPELININYIKTDRKFQIVQNKDNLELTGLGKSNNFDIAMQYKIEEDINISNSKQDKYKIFAIIFLFIFLATILILISVSHKYERNRKTVPIMQKDGNNNEITLRCDTKYLTPRQNQIYNILTKESRITQKELEKRIKIPKSSLSRNIKTLEVKGLIEKKRIGITNYIIIKK